MLWYSKLVTAYQVCSFINYKNLYIIFQSLNCPFFIINEKKKVSK